MRRQGSLFVGLILIGIGAVFLLEALGYWPEDSSAWPGVFIVIGVALFVDRLVQGDRGWLAPILFVGLGGFLLLRDADVIESEFVWPAILILFGVWLLSGAMRRGTVERDSIDVSLDGARRARVRIDHGGGELRIGALPQSSLSLCTGTVGAVEQKTSRSGDRLDVALRQRRRSAVSWIGREFRLDLNPGVDLELDLHTGASDSKLDLTRLLVNTLELKTGASSTVVHMPERGHTRATVDAGAASVEFRLPANVAGRITSDTGLAEVDVDTGRFLPSGGGYESPDFGTAVDRAEIHIRGGVAGFKVR